ncbi:hypothetical protein LLEC1_00984 [Akanthomyces lecanii]|uniref:Zn(2)-C6 fungal-type domain-containing protein n=1 Tax=Cordyceps confragosa TaxID=2714763 RepID=A0A179I135_CORDF|nr:hypothetical protein LLEC1_00984 [Akanthomyces lecanii]
MEPGERLSDPRAEEGLQTFSCLVCRQRKVRCDHAQPCSNCKRAKIDCEYVAPVRGKRKRSSAPRETLHAKLRRYEDMLKTRGVDVAEPTSAARAASEDGLSESNHTMESPTSLSVPTPGEEPVPPMGFRSALIKTPGTGPRLFHHPDDIVVSDGNDDEEHETDLFLGASTPGNSFNGQLHDWHPPMPVLRTLKDIYVDRVDPLMKIMHMPTFWASVLQVVEKGEKVSKPIEAIIFCFYFGTISILQENECEKLFRQSKKALFAKYRAIARHTLKKADLISTSSPMTLRAFCVFLMGLRGTMRYESQYVLCGVALRLAQKMGLHRDGASLGLSLFETEMRRRLWWYIAHLDFRTSDLLGAKPSLDIHIGDVQVPWNVEDEDLQPSMTEVPKDRKAITSITMCLVRCDLAKSLQRMSGSSTSVASWGDIGSNSNVTLDDKDALINEIEDKFETKYLRYCDPSRPLDILVTCMIRAAICNTRLFAHNPRRFADSGGQVSEAERDTAFYNASKLLEYASMVGENQSLRKYEWRMNSTYLWDKILFVLIEARRRTLSPELDRVWELIGRVFSQYPDAFGQSSAQAVYEVLSKWTLEVWDRYTAAKRDEGMLEPEEPAYITAMRERKESAEKESDVQVKEQEVVNKETLGGDGVQTVEVADSGEFGGFSELGLFEMNLNEWVNWEQLVSEQNSFYHVEGY